jgi:single-stranded-DNA-specific exonuclease
MSATCLLTLALRELGATAFPYIPDRFGEGYGLSAEALSRVMDRWHPDLIVTVDNGIAAKNEVEWILSRGVDVAITDHHEPAELVPIGVPVTDPKLAQDCVSRELAGAGVALKLVHELGRRRGRADLWKSYTEVAMLGTISDMMLLEGENRALVADGVANIRHTRRPGIVALAATAGVDLSRITADELPFSIVPRLNAAGRMGSVEVAFDLLITNDPAEAAVLAARLEQTNNERRETESALTEEAMADYEFKKLIKSDDRATTMELIAELHGYAIGSGMLSGDEAILQGLVSVKLKEEDPLTIGYIRRTDSYLSPYGRDYVEELLKYKEL